MLLDNIPGLKEALALVAAQEESFRDIAWLGADLEIAGQAVRQLTPRHLLLLTAARSPFVTRGQPGPEHVAQFLWTVSPDFVAGDVAKRDIYFAHIAPQVDYEIALREIDEYLDLAFMDRPPSSGVATAAIVSFVASLVHTFAWHYKSPRDETLDSPLAQLYQLRRLIEREMNPKTVFFNRLTDREKRRLVNAYLKEEQAKAATKLVEKKPTRRKR